MSSIFDSVDIATSRRKTKILDVSNSRSLFSNDISNNITHTAHAENPPEMQQNRPTDNKDINTQAFTPLPLPYNPKVDITWALSVFFSLVPVFYTMYNTIATNSFSIKMLVVPYECSLFYFGIFFGLPGITVHIFCLSLIFTKLCRPGIILAIISIFLMVVTIEQACMLEPNVSINTTFYMFALSTYLGLISQYLFISILYKQMPNRSMYSCIIGLAAVLVTLSILAIILSALNSEIPHTKSTVLIRTLPLSMASIIHAISTYWTIYPVRIVCNNM